MKYENKTKEEIGYEEIMDEIVRTCNPMGITNAYKRGKYAGKAVIYVPDGYRNIYFEMQYQYALDYNLYKTDKANDSFTQGWEDGQKELSA